MTSRGEILVLKDSKSSGETVDFESRDSIFFNDSIVKYKIRLLEQNRKPCGVKHRHTNHKS